MFMLLHTPQSIALDRIKSESSMSKMEGFWNIIKVIFGVLLVVVLYFLVKNGAIS